MIGDVTTNHTGVTHEWFRSARADQSADERGYYVWRSYPEDYLTWMGVATLPKLDHRNPRLRDRLVGGRGSAAHRWLDRPYGLDGWRIDVATMTCRHGEVDVNLDVARDLRATLELAGGGRWLVAEHGHDPSADLQGDGWHGTTDYNGFTRPVWAWLNADPDLDISLRGIGSPAVARR